ncbi:restriction endonuclease subunit S [Achromobacter xylosoxidans]|uniref:restriction endonuclease subunit S n=1 Tax=Alcaligenes xylosoxydans xylosoxydans TaxID=85698 RepID=UPI003BA61DE2
MPELDEFGYSKDFKKCHLGDVAHIEMGQSPDSRFVFDDPFGGYPFLQGNAEFGAVSPSPKFGCIRPAKLVKKGDVLISVRAPVGAVNIADRDYCIGRGLAGIRLNGIEPNLAAQLVQHQSAELRRVAQGTTFEAISKIDLQTLQLRLPPSAELPVIAKVLNTLDKAIHQTEAIVEKLKQVKQGLLHDLLTRGVDANGELRPNHEQAPHLYQESRLGWIPKEWTLRSVASLGEIKSGSTPSRGKADRYFHPEGTPWVKTLDLNEDVIFKTDECITVAALRESSCSILPVGSVLIAMYGGWEQIGRTAMLGVPAATNQAISSVTINDPEVVPEYVLRALQHGRPRWKRVAASTRKDPNITKMDVETFELPMPSTRTEQEAIVTRFRALLNRLAIEQLELHKRQEEKAGAMDDLLTGRVRVTPLLVQ